LRYGKTRALDDITLDIPAGCMVGLIGPDGVGKSSLLALVSGARAVQDGLVEVLGGDMADAGHRHEVGPRIAYMPQGLGKNLYPTLTVFENIDFFGRLFGQDRAEREHRISALTTGTGLAPFVNRPAGKLSGGMKQKLGLCCSLIHDPDLLILDEPTTGVDPLSRRQFWEMIDRIRGDRPAMSVLVATAYMEEAARFDWLAAMNAGQVLETGSPQDLLARSGSTSLEAAFIAMLPEELRRGHREVKITPRVADEGDAVAIEARGLTKRFDDFVAVDHVDFRIARGEIFGFLGSNGCGKTTTMKMLTGLLPATDGEAWLFGQTVDAKDIETRRRVGYMSQAFSLYTELTVRQNLELHARLFNVPNSEFAARVDEMARRFDLESVIDALPDALPMGQRQRLSLAVAMIHRPEMLILDEPTSGVDPVARDGFWQILIELARRDRVTIFISTHFMNEAERCDRISLMHAGRVLVSDAPAAIVAKRGAATLEDAFIAYLEDADATGTAPKLAPTAASAATKPSVPAPPGAPPRTFDPRRMLSYARREAIELRRDPIRATLAMLGTLILMVIMGYGLSLDVENLRYAVLDRDQTAISQDYILNIAGAPRYFLEQRPIEDYAELDRRMRSGELAFAIEIPPRFGRDLARGRTVEIGAWVDGAMPSRADTIRSYLDAMHQQWLSQLAFRAGVTTVADTFSIETRYRYNPDVRSLVAMVPAMFAILLMLIPAILAALSVVREKEFGSITNFYVTPVSRLEFLLGKQMPYVVIAMLNSLLMVLLAVTLFRVPLKGSFLTMEAATLVYVFASTAMGLLASTFLRTQVAAIFGTTVMTIVPVSNFSGLTDPVSSLRGLGALFGQIYPATHYMNISRGVFSKALDFSDVYTAFVPVALAGLFLLAAAVARLRKQET